MQTMIYNFSKRVFRALYFIAGLIGLVIVIGLYFDMDLFDKIILIVISILTIIVVSFNFVKYAFKYFKRIPALIVNKEYLIDNINQQKIYWSDVYEVVHQHRNKRIIIDVGDINKEKYLLTKTGLSKIIWKLNLSFTHGSFWIHTILIKVEADELFHILKMYLQLENEKRTTPNIGS